jgi:hypothetical protein
MRLARSWSVGNASLRSNPEINAAVNASPAPTVSTA